METQKHIVKTAILIDGAFYQKRVRFYLGKISPEENARILFNFCLSLLSDKNEDRKLYRIFYYDCPPSAKHVYNPVTKKSINLEETELYKETTEFHKALKSQRKVALRMGKLTDNQASYNLKPSSFKKLMNGELTVDKISENDIVLNISQKGVDMRIGVDISSLAFKKQVDQIILISGDSDFVPAAKQARREGIDFILNPLGNTISPDLYEHIDGLSNKKPSNSKSKNTNNSEYKIS